MSVFAKRCLSQGLPWDFESFLDHLMGPNSLIKMRKHFKNPSREQTNGLQIRKEKISFLPSSFGSKFYLASFLPPFSSLKDEMETFFIEFPEKTKHKTKQILPLLIKNGNSKSHFYAFKRLPDEKGNSENAKSLKCSEYQHFKQSSQPVFFRSAELIEQIAGTDKRLVSPSRSYRTLTFFPGLSHTLLISLLPPTVPTSRRRPPPSRLLFV